MNYKVVFFSIFTFVICITNAFAEPGLKIVEPTDGTVVTPGQSLTIRLEAVDGLQPNEVTLACGHWLTNLFNSLPVSYTITIPTDAAGKTTIIATAYSAQTKQSGLDQINIVVQPQATIQSLVTWRQTPNAIDVDLDWDNNIKNGSKGSAVIEDAIYSDGVRRNIYPPNLTYTSSDPSIVTVDSQGNYQILKVGNASITVSAGNASMVLPLAFHQPEGIRPAQTILPTITMDIEPKPNSAGWWNSDITITLTAQAAAQSKGISSIDYQFPHFSAQPTIVENSQAIIPFSTEGVNIFRYIAYDQEQNSTDQQSTTINLDKTPPAIILILLPVNLKPKCKEDDFPAKYFGQLSYSATDKLSGLKSSNAGLAIPDIHAFKTKLKIDNQTSIIINLKRKVVTIHAPNPQDILNQLKAVVFPIANNQVVHLNVNPARNKIRILPQDNFLAIKGPTLTLRVIATDNADNIGTKDLVYPNVNPAKIADDEDGEDQ